MGVAPTAPMGSLANTSTFNLANNISKYLRTNFGAFIKKCTIDQLIRSTIKELPNIGKTGHKTNTKVKTEGPICCVLFFVFHIFVFLYLLPVAYKVVLSLASTILHGHRPLFDIALVGLPDPCRTPPCQSRLSQP